VILKYTLRVGPSVFGFCVAAYLVCTALPVDAAEVPFVGIWSLKRLGFLIATAAIAIYFVFSVSVPRLVRFNNYLAFLGICSLFAFELIFRIKPSLIPFESRLLPTATVVEISAGRGELVDGENMIYHYQPNQRLTRFSHMTIDSSGFRNPPGQRSNSDFDIVLLGDSILMAHASEYDLGELFRRGGYSTLNLGMGGFAPQHYLDTYKAFVVDRDIAHRYVMTFLFVGNDFRDALLYDRVKAANGDYLDYVYGPKSMPGTSHWTSTIPEGILEAVNGGHRYDDLATHLERTAIRLWQFTVGARPGGKREHENDSPRILEVHLPSGSIEYPVGHGYDSWWPPLLTTDDPAWQATWEALEGVVRLAQDSGAVPIIVIVPSPASIYAEYNSNFADARKNTDRVVELILLQGLDHILVDLHDELTQAFAVEFLFLHERDCHFSTRGVRVIFDALQAFVSKGH
jgi:hypothetical protein